MKEEKYKIEIRLGDNSLVLTSNTIALSYCNSLDRQLVKAIYQIQQENENLQSQLKAKEEVIKEAREYIEKNKYFYSGLQNEDLEIGLFAIEINDLLEILSKGENKEIEFDVLKALNEDLDDDVEMSNI